METKERLLTCIVCPRGCLLTVKLEDGKPVSVAGNSCKRGLDYAINECTHPMRTLTSTVRTVGGGIVSCKTASPIPKELVFKAMKEINAVKAPDNTKMGDVLIQNVAGTDVAVVATEDA